MFNRTLIAIVTVALPLVLAACSHSRQLAACDYNDPRCGTGHYAGAAPDPGTLGSDRLFTLGRDNQSENGQGGGTGVGVSAYLWRGALETLSFMPLASADPFGGVIITDWYQPPSSSGERFKATAYILGRQLRADGATGRCGDGHVGQAHRRRIQHRSRRIGTRGVEQREHADGRGPGQGQLYEA